MKKNKMMRAASALLVATLLSTSIISGTFAKYTTSAEGSDSARVAKWGFTEDGTTITLDKLFSDKYETTVDSKAVTGENPKEDVIAPGTSGRAQFGFTYGGDTSVTAPEVAYSFNVSTNGSQCADTIKNNTNIQWKLDNGEWGTWDKLIKAIEDLDGNKTNDRYEANTLPDEFNNSTSASNLHTVEWQWVFNTDDEADKKDTEMGNAASLANVTLKVTITATQID